MTTAPRDRSRAEDPPDEAGDEGFCRIVVSAAPDGLVVVDGDGIVVACNSAAATLLGRDQAVVVGSPVAGLLGTPDDGIEGFLGPLHSGREASRVHRLVSCRRGDGGTVLLDVAVSRASLPGGSGFVAVVRDAEADVGEAWAELEARLGGIATNIPGLVFQRVREPDGRVHYPFFSSGVREILGIEPGAMRVNGEGCLEVIHWADRADHLAAIRASAASLSTYDEEFRAIARNGEVKWLRGTSRPRRGAGGTVTWDGVLIDVTERKRAEQRLEMVMDHAYDSIVTIDEAGVLQSVNAATEALFGYAVEDLLGCDVSVLMPEPHRSRHAAFISRYLETGESRVIGAGPVEVEGQHRDGKTFPLELALSEVRAEGRRIFIGVMRDITHRKKTEEALRETERRLGNIASNIPGIVFQRVLRQDGGLAFPYVSEGIRDVLGVSPRELTEDSNLFLNALSARDRQSFMDGLRISARTQEPIEDELRLTTATGEVRWLRGWSRPRRRENGDVVWDGVSLDVTDRKSAEERLHFLAYYDPVTGLGNRALFVEQFDRAAAIAAATAVPDGRGRCRIGILSLGINRFSIINATMGHAVGDHVLAAAAERLRGFVGAGDALARAGGNRFLMMLGHVKDDGDIRSAVEKILAGFSSPVPVDGQEFDISLSIGVSVHPRDARDCETLIKNADTALHRAKAEGSVPQFFTSEMGSRAARTLTLQSQIRHALENDEFVAYYQPQLDMSSGLIVGMEALARWIDPQKGVVPPNEFIPVAEESGLIDAICDRILFCACRDLRALQTDGVCSVPVAVNVSGRQFQNSRRLLSSLETILAKASIDPGLIEIELTESSAMSDPDNAIAVVNTLRDMGFSCSIDDFGTGYSSLSVLKRFPISKLKIDRSFVQDIITDNSDAAIVSAIIAMSHALKLRIVAEGVEEQAQFDFLKNRGCDQIQGYLISRPLPLEALRRFLIEGPWRTVGSSGAVREAPSHEPGRKPEAASARQQK
ncbi:MAG: EAL domain-containing protein [Alphaproteobacteria bacterium]|nr:EAL domain-containing protein [Alphaproteobacteria bacterium]